MSEMKIPAELWNPRIFDASQDDERASLQRLRDSDEVLFSHDTIEDQLQELMATMDPGARLDDKDQERARLEAAVQQHLDGAPVEEYGRWIYYPWSRRLVHVLPPVEYALLRSDRNRPRIEEQQQLDLAAKHVGIVGLSVGSSTALTLALEGVGGHFRLADYDALSLSNLNRLRAGAHNIGEAKTVVAAREMFEINPYLEIACEHEGINAGNVDGFLRGLDLVIEECDAFDVKLLVRERAKAMGIPLLMETSDRGMIDLENYRDQGDTEPFFGRLPGVTSANVDPSKKKELGLDVLGEKDISEHLAEALIEMSQGKLTTWPQLASAVTLGGATNTDTARRVLLGELSCSGRFYVDLEKIISCPEPGQPAPVEPAPPTAREVLAGLLDAGLDSLPRGELPLSKGDVDFIVKQGTEAPSAGNSQPWKYIYHQGRLLCIKDPARAWTFLDFEGRATVLAHGAAVENMVLAAASLGLEAGVTPSPLPGCPDLVCLLTFHRPQRSPDKPRLELLLRRRTNRKKCVGDPEPLTDEDRRALRQAARSRGGQLHLLTDRGAITKVGRLIGQCDRLTFVSPEMFRELTAELRWTPEEVQSTLDGIDVETLEMAGFDLKMLSILCHHSGLPLRMMRRGVARVLEKMSPGWLTAASAVGLLTVEGEGSERYFQGGRALEQVWLEATDRGIQLHPMTALVYLLARMREGGEGLSRKEKKKLEEMGRKFDKLFGLSSGLTPVLLFRLGHHTDEPSGPALRRHLEDVLDYL